MILENKTTQKCTTSIHEQVIALLVQDSIVGPGNVL